MTDQRIQELILERLDKIDERLGSVEKKVNYAIGFFAAVGGMASFAATKLYNILFG